MAVVLGLLLTTGCAGRIAHRQVRERCAMCVVCVCTYVCALCTFCMCGLRCVYVWCVYAVCVCVCYVRFVGVGLRYPLCVAALGVVIRTRNSEQAAVSRPDV